MKGKKDSKTGASEGKTSVGHADTIEVSFNSIESSSDLNAFLHNLLGKMQEESLAPNYSLSAMNHVMTRPRIYEFLTDENKEIARDIWLRLKGSGLQVSDPGLLFEARS